MMNMSDADSDSDDEQVRRPVYSGTYLDRTSHLHANSMREVVAPTQRTSWFDTTPQAAREEDHGDPSSPARKKRRLSSDMTTGAGNASRAPEMEQRRASIINNIRSYVKSSSNANQSSELSSASSSLSHDTNGDTLEQSDDRSAGKWLQDLTELAGTPPFIAVYQPTSPRQDGMAVTTFTDLSIFLPRTSGSPGSSGLSTTTADREGKGKGKQNQLPDIAEHNPLPETSTHSHNITSDRDHDEERQIWGLNDIPVEVFGMILQHLAFTDVKNLRLVSKPVEHAVSSHMFTKVVLPFNEDIYGILATEGHHTRIEDRKGKGKATIKPEVKALDMFRGFGRHIRHFGISFDVDMEKLASPPTKIIRQKHQAFFGQYEWCFPEYVRFKNRADLESAADETSVMTKAIEHLRDAQHLAISLDAGLGWLKSPGVSLRDRILDESTPVWGKSNFVTPDVRANHRRFWLSLQDAFRRAGRYGDLRYIELVYLQDDAHLEELIDIVKERRDLPNTTVKERLLHNISSGPANAFAKLSSSFVPQRFLEMVPQDVWDGMGIPAARVGSLHISIKQLLEKRYQPLRNHLELHLKPGSAAGREFNRLKSLQSSPARQELGGATDAWGRPSNENLPFGRTFSSLGSASRRPHRSLFFEDDVDLDKVMTHAEKRQQRGEAAFSIAPAKSGVLAALPYNSHGFTSTTPSISSFCTKELTKHQKEWLMETSWAQDAFLSTYMLAITDACAYIDPVFGRHTIGSNIKSLTLTRFSSKHLHRLFRDDFWHALRNLEEVTLSIIADWRDIVRNASNEAATVDIDPGEAINTVYNLILLKLSDRENLRRLSLGWADGGEEASGHFARNQQILPAPLVPKRSVLSSYDVFPDMVKFEHLEELTLRNCWLTPNMLTYLMSSHKDLKLMKLVLDSVSLTSHPRILITDVAPQPPPPPAGIVPLPNGVDPAWLTVVTNMLPGLQPLANGLPQPIPVITRVQQIVLAAQADGAALPAMVQAFVQMYPIPPDQALNTSRTGPLTATVVNHQHLLNALNHALLPPQPPLPAAPNAGAVPPGQAQLPASTPDPNANSAGYRIGSWPDVISQTTQILDNAGKSDFELVFLSCGYVVLPLAGFDQSWLQLLAVSITSLLGGEDDAELDDIDDLLMDDPDTDLFLPRRTGAFTQRLRNLTSLRNSLLADLDDRPNAATGHDLRLRPQTLTNAVPQNDYFDLLTDLGPGIADLDILPGLTNLIPPTSVNPSAWANNNATAYRSLMGRASSRRFGGLGGNRDNASLFGSLDSSSTPATTTPAITTPRVAYRKYLATIRKEIMDNYEPLFGRIISGLPEREIAGLPADWADIELGWPTEAMGLVAPEPDEVSGTDYDDLDVRARQGWRRWGRRTKEAAWFDGQKEGGTGRFSGRVRAAEGKIIEVDEFGEESVPSPEKGGIRELNRVPPPGGVGSGSAGASGPSAVGIAAAVDLGRRAMDGAMNGEGSAGTVSRAIPRHRPWGQDSIDLTDD